MRDLGALRRLVRARGVDVVHAHLSHDHWLAGLALRGLPTGLVRTVHHRRAVHRGLASRWLFRRTDAVIAVSQGIASALRAAGLAEGRVVVVPGAVDVTRFSQEADGAAFRAELDLGRRPVVGCVARIVPGRGHDLLVRAAARLRERIPEVRVVLVGRGEGRPAVERLVQELGLSGTVVFAGYRGSDLPEVLAALDCFALLGAGSEETCRAVLEAMAAGRPVVGARVGAIPETVADGETGWLVDDDPDVVADRLARVLSDPARARAMGAAGRRRAASLFTSACRARSVEAIYMRILPRVAADEE